MEDIIKNGLLGLETCEKCGYKNGFHVTFQPIKFSERAKIILKCPNCGQTYDLRWSVTFDA